MIRLLFLFSAATLSALTLKVDGIPKDCAIADVLENPVIIPLIHNISISDASIEITEESGGVFVYLSNAPFPDCELQASLEPFIELALTQDRLDRIKETILHLYETNGRPIVSVFFPEQNLSNGNLRIVVVEGNLGAYQFRGQKYSSTKKLEKMIGIESGAPINVDQVATGLAWWNRNPFRYTNAVFAPGDGFGTTNMELVTNDAFPMRPFAGADNTGNEETGYDRIFGGIQIGSIFGFDQVLNYQYTASTDWSHFWAHTGSYALPLAKQHQLFFFGGYSHLRATLSSGIFENDGKLTQISGRYQLFLGPIYGSFLHELDFGYDFKRMNTSLFFGEFAVSSTSPEINQFMIGYYLDYKASRYLVSFNAEVFASPVKITSDQTNADFQMLRPFAKNKYIYGRTRLSYTQFLAREFSLAFVGMGQYANQNLLPSEELGLGGYATVRGYAEREVNGDSGIMLSTELRMPTVSFVKKWTHKKVRDELLFYGFVDYGLAHIHRAIEVEKSNVWLLGVGPGMKYSLETNISIRAEYGFALHKTGVAPDRTGRWHLGGLVSF